MADTPTSGSPSTRSNADGPFPIGAANRLAYILTAIGAVLFLGGVFAYASFGGGFVSRVESQSSEVQVIKAREAARAGDNAKAIRLYEAAARLPWDDGQKKAWALRELATLYVDEGRADRAATTLVEAVKAAPQDAAAWDRLIRILRDSDHFKEALTTAQAWYQVNQDADNRQGMAKAALLEGELQRTAKDTDAAAAAFAKSFDAQPSVDAALAAANAYLALGTPEKARPFLDYTIKNGKPDQAKKANELLQTIR